MADSRKVPLHVTADGTEYDMDWQENKTLLDTMIAAGVNARYSCTEGRCGACQCKLEGGTTEMIDNNFLYDSEIAEGARLACQTLWKDPEGRYRVWYEF